MILNKKKLKLLMLMKSINQFKIKLLKLEKLMINFLYKNPKWKIIKILK